MATERKRVSLNDFESAIMDLEGSAESANILIHGDPGCGKTRLTSTLPGRVLWLAGEPGYIAAARGGGRGKVRVIPDTATALAAVEWLEDGHSAEFDWVVVDGVSTMNNKFLLGYAAEAFDANPAKRAHRNLPDRPDYFNAQNFTKGWIARIVDLPVNCLFTCHSWRSENRDGELRVYPGIQGKDGEVSDYISGLMHIVGYMSKRRPKSGPNKGKEVRRILWQTLIDEETDTRYIAKDQFDALGLFTDDTNMADILERIGLLKSEPEPKPATKKAATRRK